MSYLAHFELDQIRHRNPVLEYGTRLPYQFVMTILYYDSSTNCELSETCSGIMMLLLLCLFSAYCLTNHRMPSYVLVPHARSYCL